MFEWLKFWKKKPPPEPLGPDLPPPSDPIADFAAAVAADLTAREEELRAQANASDSSTFRDKQHARADEVAKWRAALSEYLP